MNTQDKSEESEIEYIQENTQISKNQNDEFHLDDRKNLDPEKLLQRRQQPDMVILKQSIDKILKKFKKEKEKSIKKAYKQQLLEYLSQYYEYSPDILGVFSDIFKPKELIQFLDANEVQKQQVIRVNTIKSCRKNVLLSLEQKKIGLSPLGSWTKVGLVIHKNPMKIPIGATPEYLQGQYMLQSPSSFLPVIALAPQPNERVLDMAAAPGGKTSYICQLMGNTGQVVANDIKLERITALQYNLFRLGVNNAMVVNYDGKELCEVFTRDKQFDRVLLDAPCTGMGIIARDPSIKTKKGRQEVDEHSELQKELLLSAIDCTKKGGYIVYSTCSVTIQENEIPVDFAIKHRNVKLVEMGLNVGVPGKTKFKKQVFSEGLDRTRRIYPHLDQVLDGFFVAKFKKLGDGSIGRQDAVDQHKNLMLEQQRKKKTKK